MAKIILGMGTSHSPQLTLKPEQWELRKKADQNNPELWFKGKPYKFDELVDVRAENWVSWWPWYNQRRRGVCPNLQDGHVIDIPFVEE